MIKVNGEVISEYGGSRFSLRFKDSVYSYNGALRLRYLNMHPFLFVMAELKFVLELKAERRRAAKVEVKSS